MNTLEQQILDYDKKIQKRIKDKLDKNEILTDEDINLYKIQDDDKGSLEILSRIVDGETIPGFTINDFLASPQAKVLIPRVLIGTARKAADPLYLVSNFFKKIRLKTSNIIQFPEFGVMRAYDVAEGQEIPAESIEWQLNSNNTIKVGKSGIRIQYSKELFNDVEFDIVGMLMSEAGRAMARHREQKAFTEFNSHAFTLFDNNLRKMDPVKWADAGTTGLDFNGNFNDTFSIDDYLDLIIAVYNNGYTPTDLIMHPLAWTAFAKNGLTGGLTAPFDREVSREKPKGSFPIGPESIQGRLPFSFNVNISNFAPIDKRNKTFDVFCVDKNNVGTFIVRDDLKTDSFIDPARDITNIKMIERYGFGIHHEGRAIVAAKNISLAKSFATPERVIQIN